MPQPPGLNPSVDSVGDSCLRQQSLQRCLKTVNDVEASLAAVSDELVALCLEEAQDRSKSDGLNDVLVEPVLTRADVAEHPPIVAKPFRKMETRHHSWISGGRIGKSRSRTSNFFQAPTSDTLRKCTCGYVPIAEELSCKMCGQQFLEKGITRRRSRQWSSRQSEGAMCRNVSIDQVLINSRLKPLQPFHHAASTLEIHDIAWGSYHLKGWLGRSLKVPILHPESNFQVAWLLFTVSLLVYEMLAIPLFVAFNINTSPGEWLFVFSSCVNVFFILDCPKSFFTGFMDIEGNVIMNPKVIACEYTRRWFLLDLAAGIPWEWLKHDTGSVKAVRIVKVIRLMRLTRLLHLVKLKTSIVRFEIFLEKSRYCTFAMGIARSLTLLFAVTHWAACGWYAVGGGSSPVRLEGVAEHKWQSYVYSLYFAWTTMTTVGYGEVHPTNFTEVCFVLFLLFVSSIVFAFLLGTLTDLIANLNCQEHALNDKKHQLGQYMSWRGVPRKLMMVIRQYLLFLWDTNAGFELFEDEVKQQLPPVLKAELCHHIYGNIISRAPFLSWLADYAICVKQLANLTQATFLEPHDIVFLKGHPNNRIYILLDGIVWLSRNVHLFAEKENNSPFIAKNCQANGASLNIPRGQDKVSLQMQITMAGALKNWSAKRDVDKVETKPTAQSTTQFESQLLTEVQKRLRRQDITRHLAAVKLQQSWRKRFQRISSAANGHEQEQSGSERWKGFQKLESKPVYAPAYFGESCLWVPYELWEKEAPPQYMYNATCETRCELVYITRDAIKQVIDRFSPWLLERFEFFRANVAEELTAVQQKNGIIA